MKEELGTPFIDENIGFVINGSEIRTLEINRNESCMQRHTLVDRPSDVFLAT